MRLVFLGPPGAGKGTQARLLAEEMGLLHVSTGDLFRDAIARGTEVGRKAQAFLDEGRLVPDEVVDALVAERLDREDARAGYILDGYPRNLAQARVLAGRTEGLDAVLLLDVADDVLARRIAGRAAEEGRTDDTEDVVAERLRVYREHTRPLIDFYREQGLLREIDGHRSIEEVFAAVRASVEELAR